jgi:hypothetical protein
MNYELIVRPALSDLRPDVCIVLHTDNRHILAEHVLSKITILLLSMI